MRYTTKMDRAIRTAVRNIVGRGATIEVGLRENDTDHAVPNCLNHKKDADLFDLRQLDFLEEIDDNAALPNCATLDLYVYTGRGSEYGLNCNVYVTIKNGEVVDVNDDDLHHNERTVALLGRNFDND
jgi:hypothetical protein